MTNNEHIDGSEKKYGQFHRRVLESRGGLFALFTTIAILIGGITHAGGGAPVRGVEQSSRVSV
jgi:hypothetical protein